MNGFAKTLWDLFVVGRSSTSGNAETADKSVTKPAPPAAPAPPKTVTRSKSGRPRMQDRYDALVVEMKQRYHLRIRKWRNSSSGCAWMVHYKDGTITRLIESPYPRGPMSCAIFLHEVGHHAIGFGVYTPRCLEEYHAWRWAIETMRAKDLNVTAAVEARMHEALEYALAKALRRGLKRVPVELQRYLPEPLLAHFADIPHEHPLNRAEVDAM